MWKPQPIAGAEKQDIQFPMRNPLEVLGGQLVETQPGPGGDFNALRRQQQAGFVTMAVDEDVVVAVAAE